MVDDQTKVRNKLQSKLFGRIGKTVTFKSKSSPIYNDRGEETNQSYSSSSITVIPFRSISDTQSYQPFGNLEEGEIDMAIPYTETIAIDDEIVMEGDTWQIKEIEHNYLPGNVVYVVRLAKKA